MRILIVEDDRLTAKQLELIVADKGHAVVAVAASAEEAWTSIMSASPDLALVDVVLGEGRSGLALGRMIGERTTTKVLFASADSLSLPADFHGAVGVIEKPFTRHAVGEALDYVSGRIADAGAGRAKPRALQLAPRYAEKWG